MDALTTPSNWQRVRLGDIGKPCMCKRVMKHQTTRYGEIPFYKIGTFGNTADAFISKKLFLEYKTKYSFPKKGDILISASGTIGRAVIYDGKPAYFQDSNIVWIDNNETLVKNDFLFYAYSNIKWNTEHTTILRLYNDNFRNTLIPLPPLNEQIAIANILSDVDHYLYSLDAIILKKESVKKALSFELLSQRKRLKGFNQNWQKVRLGTYKYRRGSFPQPYGNPQWYSDNGMPFVQVYDVGENFKLTQKTKQKISKIAQPMSVFVPKNSVIITLQGTIGRVALTQYDCYCDRTILIFDNNTLNDVNKYFFVLSLFTKFEEEKRKADGSIIKTITKQTLKDFEILLPPLNEQAAIANILSGLDSEIISLKNKKRQFENIKKALNHDLMSAKIRVFNK
ncbi:restriction endonuclease subunit S [Helicobacter pylori]|uniref:Restriction endonuclease subunit S n=1 Tax=Helicobacter pylori TaxID=210 RepID=A0ABD6HLD3_HELPX|nr:restriction endonuclease subunit S [Helicobacter pylori]MUU40622.1 restriction endonuclease subunit S [Helicobacter pylori]WQV73156.1 restriction endonuclease subunit S [Helicobacter pylori]